MRVFSPANPHFVLIATFQCFLLKEPTLVLVLLGRSLTYSRDHVAVHKKC